MVAELLAESQNDRFTPGLVMATNSILIVLSANPPLAEYANKPFSELSKFKTSELLPETNKEVVISPTIMCPPDIPSEVWRFPAISKLTPLPFMQAKTNSEPEKLKVGMNFVVARGSIVNVDGTLIVNFG